MALKTSFSRKEQIDSGLALLLLTLLVGSWLNQHFTIRFAIVEVLVLLIAPVIFYPFTFLWLNLSEFLGTIVSKIILTVVFVVLVCPVGLFRRITGKDTLMLKKFKSGTDSVFTDRNHNYTKSDFTTPY